MDHVIPHVPVRTTWSVMVLSLPVPLRLLPAAQPNLVTPVLQVVHRVLTRHLLGQTGLKTSEAQFRARSARAKPDKADQAESGAVTPIQPIFHDWGRPPT